MILPISLYGSHVLRQPTMPIDASYPNLDKLITDMFDTMHAADGIGIAAPQIGLSIRLFVIDLSPLVEEDSSFLNFHRVFINPQIIERDTEMSSMSEGCLSLPGISEKVARSTKILISYQDEHFQSHQEWYSDYPARVIQHEYDHLEQHVFTDHISPLRRTIVQGKLQKIANGRVNCRYRTSLNK